MRPGTRCRAFFRALERNIRALANPITDVVEIPGVFSMNDETLPDLRPIDHAFWSRPIVWGGI